MDKNAVVEILDNLLDISGADEMPWYEVKEITDYDFIIRTKSGKEYTGTAFDAVSYMAEKDDEEAKHRIALYRQNGRDLAFIALDSIESIIVRDKSPEEEHEAE